MSMILQRSTPTALKRRMSNYILAVQERCALSRIGWHSSANRSCHFGTRRVNTIGAQILHIIAKAQILYTYLQHKYCRVHMTAAQTCTNRSCYFGTRSVNMIGPSRICPDEGSQQDLTQSQIVPPPIMQLLIHVVRTL